MLQAWYMPDNVEDKMALNQPQPLTLVHADDLERQTGVSVIQVPVSADEHTLKETLSKFRAAAKYSYHDVIEVSRQKMGSEFEKKLEAFFDEHLHADDEVRFILDGTGYFDVRNKNEQWIRIAVKKGDFLTLPAGIYHRFTIDHGEYLKAMRLFVGEPVWTAVKRGEQADALDVRQNYLWAIRTT